MAHDSSRNSLIWLHISGRAVHAAFKSSSSANSLYGKGVQTARCGCGRACKATSADRGHRARAAPRPGRARTRCSRSGKACTQATVSLPRAMRKSVHAPFQLWKAWKGVHAHLNFSKAARAGRSARWNAVHTHFWLLQAIQARRRVWKELNARFRFRRAWTRATASPIPGTAG